MTGDISGGESKGEPSGEPKGKSKNILKGRSKGGRSYRFYMVAALVAGAVGIGVITLAVLARDGGDGVAEDPAVEDLIPQRGAEVLVQATVGIDLVDDPRYEITLALNDQVLPEDELLQAGVTNRVTYRVGEGQTVEELQQGVNCLVAEFYPLEQGPAAAREVRWCFEAL